MSYLAKTRETQIAAALGQCTASVKRTGSGQWEFELANGKPLGVSARLFEDWLLLEAPMTGRITRDGWWDLLRLNASLPGLSKFVLTPDCGRSRQTEVCRTPPYVHLRADIPLPDDGESESNCGSGIDGVLTTRLLETCAGLKGAFRSFRGEKTSDHEAPTSPVNSEGRGEQRFDELRRLCSDTAWPFIERSGGKLMIDLDVRSGFYQAAVEQRDAGTEVAVEIVRSEAFSETSRQALSLLLLGTGALVKFARPAVEETEDQIAARFEVKFTTTPTAIELAHALSSLSVACAVSGREARALQDEGIARNYLAVLGAQASLPASSGALGC